MRRGRKFFIIALLGLVIALIAYGFMPGPVLVEVAPVTRGELQVTIEAEGRTRVKNRYLISAPVAGIARRIELDVGDTVTKGQILAWLAPLRSQVLDSRSRAQAQARLAAAEAALRVTQAKEQAAIAAADYASTELSRLQHLRTTGVVAQDQLDQAESEARRSEAERNSAISAVEVAQYELEAARSELRFSAARDATESETVEQVTITAPVNGSVLKVYQRSEYVVEPGRLLLEIGDPRDLEIEVDVLSSDAVKIQPGSRVLLERWGGGTTLEGKVHLVEPVGFTKISALGVEEQRVLVIVDIVSPREQWHSLGDGYRVEARFILWQGDNVLQIPTSALMRSQQSWSVFVAKDDVAQLQKVELGQRSGFYSEITAGLEENQHVIIHPGDTLTDGSRITFNF